jgi:hypothetical protein
MAATMENPKRANRTRRNREERVKPGWPVAPEILRQTIFHPFAQMSRWGRGRVLRAQVESPTYAANYFDPRGSDNLYFPLPEVPYLKIAAVEDPSSGTVTLFALNRNLEQAMPLQVALSGLGKIGAVETALQLRHRSLKATNTKEQPERVAPTPLKGVEVKGDRVMATLAPASWNVLRVQDHSLSGLSSRRKRGPDLSSRRKPGPRCIAEMGPGFRRDDRSTPFYAVLRGGMRSVVRVRNVYRSEDPRRAAAL